MLTSNYPSSNYNSYTYSLSVWFVHVHATHSLSFMLHLVCLPSHARTMNSWSGVISTVITSGLAVRREKRGSVYARTLQRVLNSELSSCGEVRRAGSATCGAVCLTSNNLLCLREVRVTFEVEVTKCSRQCQVTCMYMCMALCDIMYSVLCTCVWHCMTSCTQPCSPLTLLNSTHPPALYILACSPVDKHMIMEFLFRVPQG